MSESKRVNLALQGGGSHGAFTWGVLDALIEDGRRHLVLGGPIDLDMPVRLLHGLADASVPWQLSLRLAERLRSRDVAVTLVKDGDHRLSSEPDLARLAQTLDALTLL